MAGIMVVRHEGPGRSNLVLMPGHTFEFNPAVHELAVGATPIFIDVDPSTLLMTAAGVEAAITQRTAAVIVEPSLVP
jgi:dTDP-4-amino-4,6-dideoxygalactose transaminase